MNYKFKLTACFILFVTRSLTAQTNVTEIAFRNADGGDDSDPYRMRKVQSSSNNNWLELQLNDDWDESFRIYGNSCVGFNCGTYSNNLYHLFNTSGNAYHAGNLGIGTSAPSTRIHIVDGVPSSVQGLNTLSKFTIDAAGGGFTEFRTTQDNNTFSGLLFTDNNLGGYVAFRNAPDDKLHVGGYGGITFEVGGDNAVGTKPERMRVDANGSIGIGTTTPRGQFDVAGSGDIYLVNNPIVGTTQSAFIPGHIYVSPYAGTDWSYFQARRLDNSGSTNFRFRTYNAGSLTEAMSILSNGNVGIGITSPDAKLAVSGQIHAQEVKVSVTVPGPDYVFEKEYKLTSLEEIKNYIDQNKHLPEVPSAKEMEKNGVQLGEMNMLLLKKIEELTLYVIEQSELIKKQNEKIMNLEKQNTASSK
jgi:hypothetical protein